MNNINKFKLKVLAFGSFFVVVILVSVFFSNKSAGSSIDQIQTANAQAPQVQSAVVSNPQPAEESQDSQAQSQVVVQPQEQPARPAPEPTSPNPAVKTTADSMSISIPKIGLNASVVTVGLESNGALHVPANGLLAGWYNNSPKPGNLAASGQVGASIITGHMDFGRNFTPGIFYNLHNLSVGDEIYVSRGDGKTAVFTVSKMETYRQDAFPTQKVYSPTSTAEIRVITCAGTYDKNSGHYTHDLVVYGTLSRIISS